MHNTIQELKGNIRVFCRIRPLSDDNEKQNGANETYGICDLTNNDPEHRTVVVHGNAEMSVDGMRSQTKSWPFTFDKVSFTFDWAY